MSWLETVISVFAVVFFIGSFDDFIIDVVHFIYGLTPKKHSDSEWSDILKKEEDPIAIFLPAWQEFDVLESMVKTNLVRIRYTNVKWFLGVYPNDRKTLKIALDLQKQYDDKIIVVVNDQAGPTTKAQMINKMLQTLFSAEEAAMMHGDQAEHLWKPRFIGIHDAEDVIHPLALKCINYQSSDTDFIQLPIFSLPVDYRQWVAGTYMDEFSDLHLKEIPVRQKLRMPIPSAGVGTFFSHKILSTMTRRFGYALDEGNLTEDYEISMRIARIGGKQQFLFLEDPSGQVVATREYFPNSFATSVRQKTRWTIGIGLQTMLKWGSFASLKKNISLANIAGKYAVWRDQKALWANPLIYLAWFILFSGFVLSIFSYGQYYSFYIPDNFATFKLEPWVMTLMYMNLALFCVRILQRMRFSAFLYGKVHGLLSFPRLFIGSVINANAAIKASLRFHSGAVKSYKSKKIEWDKTQHYFPTQEKIDKTLGDYENRIQ